MIHCQLLFLQKHSIKFKIYFFGRQTKTSSSFMRTTELKSKFLTEHFFKNLSKQNSNVFRKKRFFSFTFSLIRNKTLKKNLIERLLYNYNYTKQLLFWNRKLKEGLFQETRKTFFL